MVNNSSLKDNKCGSMIFTTKIMDCQTWWEKKSTQMKILIKTLLFGLGNFRPGCQRQTSLIGGENREPGQSGPGHFLSGSERFHLCLHE